MLERELKIWFYALNEVDSHLMFTTFSQPPACQSFKSGFVKWCGNDRLSNIWPKYILLSSLKFSSCQLSEQGSASSDRSIKVTNSSKQICIKNKISLSSVTWKFKRRSGTSFNLSQWIKFKICHFQLKSLLKQIKTVQKLFQFCPKLNNKT